MEQKYFNVQRSFGRSLINNPKLINRFYDIFISSHPAIRPLFKNTDFAHQTEVLKQGLNIAIMYAQGHPVAENTLKVLRKSHGKDGMNIDRSLYKYWIDSLIKTVTESDHKFTPDIEREWREVLQKTVDYISADAR
ncbi:MAG: hypothetical protein FD165_1241 [Gammaproteobacteria bacterium]|nr:MAG: hypothetical protein FD165_1241 [Gammaproteobacteria bacterium]TND07400.1 MAG: hypothetical protein FD120_138 [Gammaproteobacteria bacterium]